MNLTIAVTGAEQLRSQLDQAAIAFSDLTPLWPEIRDEFFAVEQELFATEGGSGAGGGWEPLSPAYAAWKAAAFGTPIEVRTGALMASLAGSGADVSMGPDSMTIGTLLSYAGYQQFGTSRMPARPVIDITESDRDRFIETARQWAEGRISEIFA